MQKLFTMMLIFLFSISLFGCSDDNNSSSNETNKPNNETGKPEVEKPVITDKEAVVIGQKKTFTLPFTNNSNDKISLYIKVDFNNSPEFKITQSTCGTMIGYDNEYRHSLNPKSSCEITYEFTPGDSLYTQQVKVYVDYYSNLGNVCMNPTNNKIKENTKHKEYIYNHYTMRDKTKSPQPIFYDLGKAVYKIKWDYIFTNPKEELLKLPNGDYFIQNADSLTLTPNEKNCSLTSYGKLTVVNNVCKVFVNNSCTATNSSIKTNYTIFTMKDYEYEYKEINNNEELLFDINNKHNKKVYILKFASNNSFSIDGLNKDKFTIKETPYNSCSIKKQADEYNVTMPGKPGDDSEECFVAVDLIDSIKNQAGNYEAEIVIGSELKQFTAKVENLAETLNEDFKHNYCN